MKPLGAWMVRLAMAGSCLAWAGCGGGDVPDPDSDSSAAAEQSAKIVDKGAEAPAAPAAEAPAAPAEAPAPVVIKAKDTPAIAAPAEPEKPAAEVVADGEKAAPVAKGDASGTEDLARLAAAPAAPAPEGGASAPAGTAPATAGNAPMANNASFSAGGPAATSAPPGLALGAPGGGSMLGKPGGRVGKGGDLSTPGEGGMTIPAAPGGFGPGPGAAPGAPGGGGMGLAGDADLGSVSKMGNAAFNHPTTAVTAFLAALKSKDKDRLSQATARRAATEADVKHQKIFAAIIEQSISDEELDDMSQALDGFRVIGQLPFKSTGKVGVMVAKQSGRDTLRRTLQVRKEKEGWKVMDIESMYDFKPGLPPMFRGGRGRRR